MVTIKPKTVVTMKMAGACTTHARTDVTVRDITVVIDEPAERGDRISARRRPKPSWRR